LISLALAAAGHPAGWQVPRAAVCRQTAAAIATTSRDGRDLMNALRRVLRRGLVAGLLLVALAGTLQPQAAQASHACAVSETGHLGWRICETMPGRATVGGRRHIFVTGTDYAIWYAWQVRPGGPWSTWHSLHGQAYHNPDENIYAGPVACVMTTNEVVLYVIYEG
jgi:hypothetical protein